MFEVKVTGIDSLHNYLEALAKGELAFGIAKGLTDLADASRNDFVNTLPNKFTLRTGWWKPRSKFGFNVQMAKKDSLVSSIYTRAAWMMLQESGGIKKSSNHRLAIPTDQVRRSKRDLIPKSQKPLALSKAFPIHLRSGKDMLAMRVGRGKKSTLRFMYTLSQQAEIKPTLHFKDNINEFVARHGRKFMQGGIDYALRTAK